MKWWWSLALLVAGCGGAVDELNLASTSQQCPQSTVEGVDVYQGDTPIVWTTVQSSGRAFAFTKVSQGNYSTQSNFATNWSTLKQIGMLRGPYHYFDATVDGVLQAEWFLNHLNAAGGIEPGDLPPVLDLECPTSPTQDDPGNLCLGGNANGWAPTATIIQRVWDWLDTVEAATGMKPIIYSYVSWFGDFGFTDSKLTRYPLWIASVASPTCATVPAPWTEATFWQYSSTHSVPGIGATATTHADEDRFMGSQAQLNAFVASQLMNDGGSDGMLDGSAVDLAGPPSDLAKPVTDAAAAPDLASGKKSHAHKGCDCQLGSSDSPSGGWLGFALFAAAVLLRRRRATI